MSGPSLVVMGVSGCGKTTVGAALAATLGARFVDAADLHPPENVARMSAGLPLREADRDRLRAGDPRAVFLHLDVPDRVLRDRVAARTGHFMPATLLDSQLATLEPLAEDERGLTWPLGVGPHETFS